MLQTIHYFDKNIGYTNDPDEAKHTLSVDKPDIIDTVMKKKGDVLKWYLGYVKGLSLQKNQMKIAVLINNECEKEKVFIHSGDSNTIIEKKNADTQYVADYIFTRKTYEYALDNHLGRYENRRCLSIFYFVCIDSKELVTKKTKYEMSSELSEKVVKLEERYDDISKMCAVESLEADYRIYKCEKTIGYYGLGKIPFYKKTDGADLFDMQEIFEMTINYLPSVFKDCRVNDDGYLAHTFEWI